uniref:AP2/ERF domain-containing protein n=1 Tax=Ananas comosus var. bracteatus TaxID=296719 RepID=A0A6V7PLS1_ANACO|nr:unnamed protein product [Ananas comosus var. bracteatus]
MILIITDPSGRSQPSDLALTDPAGPPPIRPSAAPPPPSGARPISLRDQQDRDSGSRTPPPKNVREEEEVDEDEAIGEDVQGDTDAEVGEVGGGDSGAEQAQPDLARLLRHRRGAARAYDTAVLFLRGRSAKLNFPDAATPTTTTTPSSPPPPPLRSSQYHHHPTTTTTLRRRTSSEGRPLRSAPGSTPCGLPPLRLRLPLPLQPREGTRAGSKRSTSTRFLPKTTRAAAGTLTKSL